MTLYYTRYFQRTYPIKKKRNMFKLNEYAIDVSTMQI
jgi:hypothetical protein